jgi:CheY-like chemotaxis protein
MREVTTPNCTVLVADDSPDMLEMIGTGLRMAGYQVCLVNNGSEALDFLQDNRCDVIVSDLMMPTMGGVELLRSVRARDHLKGVPFILMSAAHADLRLLAAKADAILEKPFDFNKLLRLLARVAGEPIKP